MIRAVVVCLIGLGLACHEESSEVARPVSPIWPSGSLVDVSVPADGRAVVVASDGRIFLTRDAGDHWEIASRPAVEGLRGVVMASPEVGWAFGAGVVLRTDDGGRRWRRQRLPARAADLDLRALGVVDGRRALLVGAAGLRLLTRDAGGLWQHASIEPSVPDQPAPTLAAVECLADGSGRCISVDREVRFSADAGDSFTVVDRADSLVLAPIEFAFGRVEIPEEAGLRLAAAVVSRPRKAEIRWRIEAGLGVSELDEIGGERDASALFALVEARAEELRLALEAAGVDPDRIETSAPPPWDYVDRVDDDPAVLARYWAGRTALGSRARIRTRERIGVRALALDGMDLGLVVGAAGRGLRSLRVDARWEPVAIDVPYDLLAVDLVGGQAVAVGQQGGIWRSDDRLEDWARLELEGGEQVFETLRAVDFDPEGRFGLATGEHGRLLRSLDGGRTWRLLAPPPQENRLSRR